MLNSRALAVAFVNSPKGVDYSAEKNTAALSAIFNCTKTTSERSDGPMAFINQRRRASPA